MVIHTPRRAQTFKVTDQASDVPDDFMTLTMIDKTNDAYIEVLFERLPHTLEDSLEMEVCYSYGDGAYSQL